MKSSTFAQGLPKWSSTLWKHKKNWKQYIRCQFFCNSLIWIRFNKIKIKHGNILIMGSFHSQLTPKWVKMRTGQEKLVSSFCVGFLSLIMIGDIHLPKPHQQFSNSVNLLVNAFYSWGSIWCTLRTKVGKKDCFHNVFICCLIVKPPFSQEGKMTYFRKRFVKMNLKSTCCR